MIYLICKDWLNTSNNHAGIKYLCNYFSTNYPQDFCSIIQPLNKRRINNNSLISKIYKKIVLDRLNKIQNTREAIKIVNNLKKLIRKDDIIVLMEYMDVNVNQYEIIKRLNKCDLPFRIFGMSHLTPMLMKKMFSKKEIEKWISKVDGLITLGTSLSAFYMKNGINDSRIKTTFHYVDDYYIESPQRHDSFKVLVQGSQARDYNTLIPIIRDNPTISFVICQGLGNKQQFSLFPNVELKSYLSEQELKKLMSDCDVSLNVMLDTVGSNVIVTSMGMGLAMICSEVGSIHDYCDNNNTFFCNRVEDFNRAIQKLHSDRELLFSMRQSSFEKSKDFRLNAFYIEFKKILEE